VTVTSPTAFHPGYRPHARAERLVAGGRFVLAFSSLAAVYLEPSTPARYQQATYTLLAVYTIYAAVAAAMTWRSPVPSSRWRLGSHAVDLVLFTVFVYLTEGPASPFFLYFVFSLFCATLRFSWRGILATGVAAMAIYGAMAFLASYNHPGFEASRAVIRIAYLAVIIALLVYLGVYHQQLRSELASLAAWPRELTAQLDGVLRVTLAHAAAVVRADRVLLLWEESEEPWVYAAAFHRDAFRIDRLPPGTFDSPDAERLRNRTAWVRDRASLLVYDPASSAATEDAGDPIGDPLRQRYDVNDAIVVSLVTETLTARFVVQDVRSATADDLALAHVAGRLVLATLDQFFFVRQVRQTAGTEERLRISRDLHDGIVQSLAGIGLRLHALRSRFAADADVARELVEVQRVLEQDQRELRTLVRELRPHDPRDGEAILAAELRRTIERFPLEWGLAVALEVPAPFAVPARLAHDLCRIVNESLSNAARHGAASRAEVTLARRNGFVDLRVSDNGRGFPFAGRYDLAALDRAGVGPRTLKERARTLGGTLAVDSSRSGATVEIRLPVGEESR
jgi:signal transduction histidine kinase